MVDCSSLAQLRALSTISKQFDCIQHGEVVPVLRECWAIPLALYRFHFFEWCCCWRFDGLVISTTAN